ncbi:Type IV secretory pathway, TrbL components [Helicobacter fennelliae]|uniref:Type IV secretory pathway, TrbL components n=1 Tax=Helicobacter fennelliae TaxID=215 RepID=A0A2X3GMD5_9HELI|nr:type IV secretion system protein [Helicobacter fennelliae]SQC36280.1 Type IV secretory pathway, TrbL components [Helicobacter fennelliae]
MEVFKLIVNIVNGSSIELMKNVYAGCADVYVSSIAYTLFGLSIVMWGFLKIRGDWSRNDLFKAMIFCLIFIIVQASLSSFENYQTALNIFKIPSYWFNAGVSAFSGGSFDLEGMVNLQMNTINTNFGYMYDEGGITDPMPWILAGLYWLIGMAFLIILIVMTVLSQFMANIILSLGALVFPLVIWQQTKSIFFSWLKLYISLSLWSPFALLLSGIPTSVMQNIQQGNILGASGEALTYTALISIVLMLFSIFLLTKIPSWVSTIIGSADSSGSGSGLAGLAAGSMLAATRAMKGGAAGITSKLEGGSLGNSILGGIGQAIGGKTGEKAAQWGGSKLGQGLKTITDKFRSSDTPHISK